MGKLFYDKIKSYADTAKGARHKVALFLLKHTDEAAFMNINDLAEATQVSTGTVSTTIREMGFSGFSSLQSQIRSVAKKSFSPVARLEHATEKSGNLQLWLETEIENLRMLLHKNTAKDIEKAVDMLLAAPAVHIMGLRSSYAIAHFLCIGLERLRRNVFLLDGIGGRLPEHIRRINPGDLVVLTTFPRYVRNVVLMAQEAKIQKCKLLSITDSPFSPIARHADHVLLAAYESNSFFNSHTSSLCLCNLLLTRIIERLGEKGKEELNRHDKLLHRWSILAETNDPLDTDPK